MFRVDKPEKIDVYCGFWRTTVVKCRARIISDVAFEIDCLECGGTGVFDCGIPEERGDCVACKGTGKEYLGI